jgi:hypothetical protein
MCCCRAKIHRSFRTRRLLQIAIHTPEFNQKQGTSNEESGIKTKSRLSDVKATRKIQIHQTASMHTSYRMIAMPP